MLRDIDRRGVSVTEDGTIGDLYEQFVSVRHFQVHACIL